MMARVSFLWEYMLFSEVADLAVRCVLLGLDSSIAFAEPSPTSASPCCHSSFAPDDHNDDVASDSLVTSTPPAPLFLSFSFFVAYCMYRSHARCLVQLLLFDFLEVAAGHGG
mmetsp:Transcript_34533/g.110903  ORF Transcript_34533/g.110903 Transcript_34533/m.110903 type:complete len:112 (+) Transcript_34533:406-741(+)